MFLRPWTALIFLLFAAPAFAQDAPTPATTREDKLDFNKPQTKKPGQRVGPQEVNSKKKKKKKPPPPPPPPEKTFEQKVLDTGDKIEKRVDRVAESIDLRLAGKKYTKKANKSGASVSQYVTHTEGGNLRTSTDFGLNLRLPNLEKRWQLRFTSYDEEAENRDLQQKRVRIRPREREYGAGFFFFKKLGNIKTTFQPRLELRDPLEVSYVLRFESSAERGKYRIAPRFELFADPQKGTGEYLSLEFTVELTDRLELSIQNTEEYRERENFFTTQHGIGVDYSLTDTQAVGAGVTAGSHNREAFHLDSHVVSTSYAQQIYKDRLRYSVTPFLSFTKSRRNKGEAGISTNMELTF